MDHWIKMISQDVQVILAVDPTMQGNDGTEKILRYTCPNHHWSTSVLHCGKKAVRVVSFSGLPPHINSPCSWEKIESGLVGEYPQYSFVFRPDLVISTPLQPLLNVDSEKQKFLDGSSSMISGFIELTVNIFGWNRIIQMLIKLSSHFGGSSPMFSFHMRFNARQSPLVSLEVWPELHRLLEVFRASWILS